MWVPIVSWPEVNKNPGATAATVHHKSIIQIWVFDIGGFKVSYPSQIPKMDKIEMSWIYEEDKHSLRLITGLH